MINNNSAHATMLQSSYFFLSIGISRAYTKKKNTRKKESKKKIIKKNSQKKNVSVGDAIADCCNNMEKYRSHNFTVPNEIKIY